MLNTIEVEIDAHGVIRPLEPLPLQGKVKGLLTLLPVSVTSPPCSRDGKTVTIESLFGIVRATQTVTLEDMDRVIRGQGGES